MGLSADMAKRIGAFSQDDVTEEALHWARIGLIDYAGVTLAGSKVSRTQ